MSRVTGPDSSSLGGLVLPLSPNDPRQIGSYRVLARLGEGAMGRVLLGVGPDGRPVAVKLVAEWLVRDEEFRARFRREVSASQRVSGAYTAAVLAAGPDDPTPWLASEFLPGPTLLEAGDAVGPLPEATVLRLAAGLASALAAIHQAGLIHRDLKPGNVILADDGPRVIDFGIARAAEGVGSDLTRTGSVIGTPAYMSPEQAESKPLTGASDIFSLGSMLVMACTGISPFAAESTLQTLNSVVRAEPDLSEVPERVRRVAARCLAREPALRATPAEIAAMVGQVPPATSPWPDEMAVLADKQRRELARLLDQAGEHTTLIDNGKTMITANSPHQPVGQTPATTGTSRRRALAMAGFGLGALAATGFGFGVWRGRTAIPVPEQRWVFDTGYFIFDSSPVVADGTVYIGNMNGVVYALDARTGEERWNVPPAIDLEAFPTVSGDTVYIAGSGSSGGLQAIDSATGEERWVFATDSVIYSPPVVDGDTVYVGDGSARLYAVDAHSGDERWTARGGRSMQASPRVVNGIVYVGTGYAPDGDDDGDVFAVDAATGEPIWPVSADGWIESTPAVTGNRLYIGTGIGLDRGESGSLLALDTTTGDEQWVFSTSAPVASSPAVADETVYFGCRDGNLYAVDADSGNERWVFHTDSFVDSSPVVADGTVYFGSLDGHLYAVDAATGEAKWALPTGGWIRSSPAVAGDTVYVGCSDGRLYAVII
jgi:outer membrane protein assembly factor BamB